jgi:peptidylprolyl isomerase
MSLEEQAKQMVEDGFVEVPGTDGGLLKKIIKEGTGEDIPQKGMMVSVHYTGTLHSDGSKFDSSRDRPGYFDFQVGVGQVIKGWDVGICTMKLGELCMLRCRSDYAYGPGGSPPTIPPNAILNFEVELFDFHEKEKEPWELSTAEKVATAEKYKAKGNAAFKEGNWAAARTSYAKGATFVADLFKKDDETALEEATEADKAQAKDVALALHQNSAQANLKLAEYNGAICDCNSALDIDGSSVKALFRRGQAYSKRSEFAEAKADLSKALELDPENKEVAAELKRCNAAAKKAAEQEKAMYSKMAGMFGK